MVIKRILTPGFVYFQLKTYSGNRWALAQLWKQTNLKKIPCCCNIIDNLNPTKSLWLYPSQGQWSGYHLTTFRTWPPPSCTNLYYLVCVSQPFLHVWVSITLHVRVIHPLHVLVVITLHVQLCHRPDQPLSWKKRLWC